VDLLDRVTDAVVSAAEVVSGAIWNQIWNQTDRKSQIGHPGFTEVPDSFGGPSRTRTLDPLIKSEHPDACNARDEHARRGTCESVDDHERRPKAGESGLVGTNVEPEQRASPISLGRGREPRRPDPRRVTYLRIRAYIYSRHGFSPRTGWIAHVKELNGLTLRHTHNRRGPMRADPCPPERRAIIEAALRHFGVL
jgi:hypothetical protein